MDHIRLDDCQDHSLIFQPWLLVMLQETVIIGLKYGLYCQFLNFFM